MEKKRYENPSVEIEEIEVDDVITTSTLTDTEPPCEDWGGGAACPFDF
jgi:hypothetical protein